MALAWWSVLLFTKNRDAFYAKRDLMEIGMAAEGIINSHEAFLQTERYRELSRQYKRQEWMIMGEAAVFAVSLVIGIWFINRGYFKQMLAAQQRRNFLLSITHELKSPIASIRLVLETILKRDLQRDKLEQVSRNALKETDRLNNLVNDLLLSAKLENAYQPHREDIELPVLIEELIQKLETKYPRAEFRLHLGGQPIPAIRADRMGLTSVALNLLENAVKYSPAPPEIDIRLSYQDQQLQLEVADQGIGINDKEKKHIFDKFYRVGNEDTRRTKGTGLGLYIVNQIVRAHGGTIEVLDNQPRGTVFRILLDPEKLKGTTTVSSAPESAQTDIPNPVN